MLPRKSSQAASSRDSRRGRVSFADTVFSLFLIWRVCSGNVQTINLTWQGLSVQHPDLERERQEFLDFPSLWGNKAIPKALQSRDDQ